MRVIVHEAPGVHKRIETQVGPYHKHKKKPKKNYLPGQIYTSLSVCPLINFLIIQCNYQNTSITSM